MSMRAPARKYLIVGAAISSQRGVALIVVLWIFVFLFVVAFDFSASVREEATAAHRFNDEMQGYYLALAGFEKGLFEFLQQPNAAVQARETKRSDLFDGTWREENFGAGAFRVRLIDEGGKININRVNEETLRRVFSNLGIDGARGDVLVDSIMDWRDEDDLHRTNGAENDYYAGLSPPYSAKNGALDSVEDLLWIRGMTADLFFGRGDSKEGPSIDAPERIALKEIFTVDSPIDRVNLRTASAEVIHAVLGISLEKCRGFVEERKKSSEKTLADLLPLLGLGSGDPALRLFIFTNPAVVAVEAEGKLADGALRRRVKGIVRLGGARGYELLRWLDRDFPLPQS